ncbi:Redox-sensitive transcriptional activator SoxR [Defluviimonas aquaemixtae]|uniref:Redox-sensitive transcriptional activator SoxR n=1 Tax=Albidovulum aquaemixtae TaxID=1542388 RepID=A0A2R8B4E4_9RHOB|nr:redox-sensitive transcriptional activator SoxR [Defluviimonas aquaemixtae]SPH17486.1 Redox-sensitive transcriptional activator SoxR [Defluviimonas aquaemixtae]
MERELSIGALARRTGLSVSAIRFYEERRLVRPSRNSGGQRRFARSDIRRLSFVMIAQRLGYTITEIAARLSELPESRTPDAEDWRRLAEGFRAELDQRIALLESFRDRLDGCIGCGCLSLKTCAFHNPDDQAAANGAGPRYLLGDNPVQP